MTGKERPAAGAEPFFIDPEALGVVDHREVLAPAGGDEIDITLLLDGLLGPVADTSAAVQSSGEHQDGLSFAFDGGPITVLPSLTIILDEPTQGGPTFL